VDLRAPSAIWYQYLSSRPNRIRFHQRLFIVSFVFLSAALIPLRGNAQITAVSLQSPALSGTGTTSLVSPIHVLATAEDSSLVTGYVVYVDNQNAYSNSSASIDAWIAIPLGQHTIFLAASDSHGTVTTPNYQIDITGFAPPTPPPYAQRMLGIDAGAWEVDNSPQVGGNCNDGSIGSFHSDADPNTANRPQSGAPGQHFILTSHCQYDDSLFYRKYDSDPAHFEADTNFLWDFWFYIPSRTRSNAVQAFEFDLFDAVPLSDGVHEFMFGSQCDYQANQWNFWLPSGNVLAWVAPGDMPCEFSSGVWHHATYFLQRVTPSGYQAIPASFTPSTDPNTSLRFGTVTIDGQTAYIGGVSWSTIPNPAWSPVLGVQHQLDSSQSGVVIEEFVDSESLTTW
jgi:hypothetical protein